MKAKIGYNRHRMEETPFPFSSEPPPPQKLPLPEPRPSPPVPSNLRWPLEGRMDSPTVPPIAISARRNELQASLRRRRRRGFLIGLVVGQLFVLALVFGGEALIKLRPELRIDLPVRTVVFAGVTAGLALTGVLIGLLLMIEGLLYVVRPKGKPFGVALANGFRRTVRALLSLGITLIVVSGTAAAGVPIDQWKPQGRQLWQRLKGAVEKLAERKASPPKPEPIRP